jgi:N-acetylglucosamine-6-phosphate deacetylase
VEAIATVTVTPAAVLGLTTKGTIRAGADGDLVLLTDELEVVATVIAGRVVFDRRCAATMSG